MIYTQMMNHQILLKSYIITIFYCIKKIVTPIFFKGYIISGKGGSNFASSNYKFSCVTILYLFLIPFIRTSIYASCQQIYIIQNVIPRVDRQTNSFISGYLFACNENPILNFYCLQLYHITLYI